ncbi:MAG: hypothetical protein M0R70_09145 [Nitrospirae bacterium]|nr:hypothetical protein [Nitrospirota bacterium]
MKQIGRKLYHLVGGVGLLSVYYVLGRKQALLFYAALFLLILAIDGARLMIPAWNRALFARFGSFIRKNEEHRLTGTAPYVLGIGLSLYAYSTPVASAAICFLVFGDVAATAIGERFGKTKIGDKSLEGSLAFIVAAAVSGLLLSLWGVHLPVGVMLLGVLVAAGVELLTISMNDNLLIPLMSGGIMELALRTVG